MNSFVKIWVDAISIIAILITLIDGIHSNYMTLEYILTPPREQAMDGVDKHISRFSPSKEEFDGIYDKQERIVRRRRIISVMGFFNNAGYYSSDKKIINT